MPKLVAEKSDWIKLGFKLFAEKGEAGIIVDKMADKLKCNRSSFYWHFSKKEAFIDQIVAYWVEIDTHQIIKLTNKQGTVHEKLLKLLEVTFKKDPFMDFVFYLKRYSKKKKHIQKIINDIDMQRIEYTAELFRGLGLAKDEAAIKANITYKYLIGYHEMIRYKKQEHDYVQNVYKELKHFLPL